MICRLKMRGSSESPEIVEVSHEGRPHHAAVTSWRTVKYSLTVAVSSGAPIPLRPVGAKTRRRGNRTGGRAENTRFSSYPPPWRRHNTQRTESCLYVSTRTALRRNASYQATTALLRPAYRGFRCSLAETARRSTRGTGCQLPPCTSEKPCERQQ